MAQTSHVAEIRRGETDTTQGVQLTRETRRDCDLEYYRRAERFVRDCASDDAPFFLYYNHSLMHFPVIPREEFRAASGQGAWADALLPLDADFGQLLDLLDELGIADNTIVVFAGDNGPEDMTPWRGSPGYWQGSYFAGGEGNLRTPCIARWPGRIPAGRDSDEIMHVVDWFTTLLNAAGVAIPDDRMIDGLNQLPWLSGDTEESAREGYLFWMGAQFYGVKWRNFKMVKVEQQHMFDPPHTLSTPRITNLTVDPHEREHFNYPHVHTWAGAHFSRLVTDFHASVAQEPLIPLGAPLEHTPYEQE